MPIPQLGGLSSNPSMDDVVNYLVKLERQLKYLLEAGLDSANAHEFGGYFIDSNTLQAKSKEVGLSSLVAGGDDVRIWAGSNDMNSAPFRVTESGSLVASNADITGKVTATSGMIGGWTIGSKSLYSSSFGNRISLTTDYINNGTNIPAVVLYDNAGVEAARLVSNFSGRADLQGPGNSWLTLAGESLLNGDNIYLIVQDTSGAAYVEYSGVDSRISKSGDTTSTVGNHSHGIPDGTVLMVDGGGTVTFFSSGAHSHSL